jgi:hypothetical protein
VDINGNIEWPTAPQSPSPRGLIEIENLDLYVGEGFHSKNIDATKLLNLRT